MEMPKTIYLQQEEGFEKPDITDTTWCIDKVNVTDIPYKLFSFTYKNIWFYIQAYNRDDFFNICCEHFPSIRYDVGEKSFSTWGKQTDQWKAFIQEMDVKEVIRLIEFSLSQP